jgi:hypothetical protein
MIDNNELVKDINQALELALPEKISFEALHMQLAAHINRLINNNFESLVSLLYKIDVDESKLKFHLPNNPNEDAGNIIASLIIERMQQKAEFKKQFTNDSSADSNEEKW